MIFFFRVISNIAWTITIKFKCNEKLFNYIYSTCNQKIIFTKYNTCNVPVIKYK